MNLIEKFLGKRQASKVDYTDAPGIELMLRSHLGRLSSFLDSQPRVKAHMDPLLMKLLEQNFLTSTAQTVKRSLSFSLKDKKFHHEIIVVGEYFVAITTCPWVKVSEVQAHMPVGGYLNLLNDLTRPAYKEYEGKHVVHWIYCSDGQEAAVHLTFIPNPATVNTSYTFPILATDLMTQAEKAQLGGRLR